VNELVRTLPKQVRRDLVPLADVTRAAYERLGEPDGRLVDRLAEAIREVAGVPIPSDAFDPARVPAHLRLNFVVSDDDGTVLDADDDLAAIRRRLGGVARAAVAAAAPIDERRGLVDWDFGELPRVVESSNGSHIVRGFPTLVDDGTSVSLRVVTNPDLQRRALRGGVRRLLVLTAAPSRRALERGLDRQQRLAIASGPISLDELLDECIAAAADRVLLDADELPWDAGAFAALQADARRRIATLAADAAGAAADALVVAARVQLRLDSLRAPSLERSVRDAQEQLDRLVRPGFVAATGTRRIADVVRYVRGIEHRLDRLADDVARDERRMGEVRPLERRYSSLLTRLPRGPVPAEVVELGWSLEELRVSVFAQQIGAKGAVSAKRISKELTALGG
jgi:ATP-dependent helicase HrpA